MVLRSHRIPGGRRLAIRVAFLVSALAVGAASRPAGASGTGGFDPPEVVYGGNALSLLAPFQIGIVGYLPKARVGIAYARQIDRPHWIHVWAGYLADRGDFRNFRMDRCGFEDPDGDLPAGLCGPGAVMGFDLAVGYTHKFYLADRPHLVPFVRAGIGVAWWKLPRLRGGDARRLQVRTDTLALRLDPAGGLRWFLAPDLGLGFEVQVPIGALVHRELPPSGKARRTGGFLLGIATLLGLEYRF